MSRKSPVPATCIINGLTSIELSAVQAQFFIGQQVTHRLFEYRGLVFDVDPVFSGTEEWYDTMAKSKPPKDAPWYHVLVHEADHTTYVAERNLIAFDGVDYIDHPLLPAFFDGFQDGVYQPKRGLN
ncbi:MAG TPA: heat shock protein HspQ [Gammaproteobacteria bacterium]|nr:heat shock protein HspQ [Gammaproteobacteria bacterium]